LRSKKHRSHLWTFIVFSNATKPVMRVNIPKLFIYLLALCTLVPLLFIAYFFIINSQLLSENTQLSNNLDGRTEELEKLEVNIKLLEGETAGYHTKIEKLTSLELQMQEYLANIEGTIEKTTLHTDSSGGIDISIPVSKVGDSDALVSTRVNIDSQELIENYQVTIQEMDQINETLKTIPTAWPADVNLITSDFGLRQDPFHSSSAFHTGIDLGGPTGTLIYASADGVVTLAEFNGSYGNTIKIRHSSTYETLYGHLSSIIVKDGAPVKKGDIIGKMGSTGRSTGPHLHYEILENNNPINPYPYMTFFKN
jgi:murein DD-endopeptidase MepM/ murein hydrolase activator NlpD